MRLGLGLNMLAAIQNSGGTPTPSAPVSINTDGAGATWLSGSPVIPTSLTVSRQGFDDTGAPNVESETITLTKQGRLVAPNMLTADPTLVWMSDWLASTDTLVGGTNNATGTIPKGAANWQQMDGGIVKNSLSGSIVGGGITARQARTFRCVKIIATDQHGHTATQTINAMTLGPLGRDRTRVWEWRYDLDVSSFTDGDLITLNAECYPFRGGAGSVLKSADNAVNGRTFSPQTYIKNVSRFDNPPIVYLDETTGNDTTGAVSTNDATAAAAPCLTLNGALARARAVLGTASGSLNGLVIKARERAAGAAWALTSTATANTVQGVVTFTRAAGANKANVIYGFGAVNAGYSLSFFRILDVSMARLGSFQIGSGKLALRDVDFNNNGQASTSPFTNDIWIEGGFTLTGYAASTLNPASTTSMCLIRGVYADNGSNGVNGVHGHNIVGCDLRGFNLSNAGSKTFNGMTCFANIWAGVNGSWMDINEQVTSLFVAHNAVTIVSTSVAHVGMRLCGDAVIGVNDSGFAIYNNSIPGANNIGRRNMLYDETGVADPSNSPTYFADCFNITCQDNHKNDWFQFARNGITNNHKGSWPWSNGVGRKYNWVMYADAGPDSPDFRADYPGVGSVVGTSNSVKNDPLFIDYQGVTYNGSTYSFTGTGRSDLHLQAGSPCKNVIPPALAAFPGGIDDDGSTGPLTSLGAYL